jgi:predicted transcriptional regulator
MVRRLYRRGKNLGEIADAVGITRQGVYGHVRRLRRDGEID